MTPNVYMCVCVCSFFGYSASSNRDGFEDGLDASSIGGVADPRYEGRPNFIVFN